MFEMELEQALAEIVILEEPRAAEEISQNQSKNEVSMAVSFKTSTSETETSYDFCNHSESFKKLVEMGLPFIDSVEEKLSWLRSQIIGDDDVEFDSPFGRRRLLYADHTASGRSILYNEQFIIKHVLPFYGNTHTCDSYVGSRTTKMVHEASQYIKTCLGGGENDVIILCGSGTTGAIKRLQQVMGIAVPSILRERMVKCLDPQERWLVFVGPHEHHSNLLSWRQSLAEVIEIGLDENGLLDMQALTKHLEAYKSTNRPILASFSACSNVTGVFTDTQAIAQLVHQYGGYACFDFAASGPYVEIDMRSGQNDGYDAVFLSPHKFLGGPGSPGILLMNKALYQLGSSPPSTCGGGTVDYVNGFNEKDTLYLENIQERENAGTPQIIQTVRAALAFWVKEYTGYQAIEEREQMFIKRALERLLPNPNIEILGNVDCKRQAILSFVIHSSKAKEERVEGELDLWAETGRTRGTGKPLHGPFVATLLNDLFGIQARGGCACAGPYGHHLLNITKSHSLNIRSAVQQGYVGVKPGWTRVSFPYYMREEDFEFILKAVEFIAIYGPRFLPFYSFNLRNGSWRLKTQQQLEALTKQDDGNVAIEMLQNALEEVNINKNCDLKAFKQVGMVTRNELYLAAAEGIAKCLPKFPSERRLHGDIDPRVLHFRV
ncbi:hypothetical protein L6164_025018 [Bauhinia variegata]|uniref:Uncharacterized protein n=1 Tax=Bauhinia variegata TaxID=167791 RepID=A0ACB9M058_BAUVA|nr:hypothetical protein L6164_025018 [Bauhinia variegata]